MTRILAAGFYLLLIGTAAAQAPVDYILLCDAAVIGTAGYVDSEFHVAVLEGLDECAVPVLALSTVGQEVLTVTSEWFEGVLTVTIGEMEGVAAMVVPRPALDGMASAVQNLADAGELTRQGQETATENRAEHQSELPEPAGDGERPAAESREERQPEPPSLPEPATNRP